MTRHQRLRRTMRSPARQHRRAKNRIHRRARQKAGEEFAAWMRERLWAQQLIQDELLGMQVQRPQAIAEVTSV
jgi:hypothetical protein